MGHQGRHYNDLFQALQQLGNPLEQLDAESQTHPNDPPPPYQSPTESTRPPSLFDISDPDALASPIDCRQFNPPSLPYEQFRLYSVRERDRLIYQWENKRNGRKQTLPFERTTDLLANAQNNVRAYWLEEGIWKDEWGPAWPQGAQIGENRWLSSDQNTGGPRPLGHWAHETIVDPITHAETETNEGLFGAAQVRNRHAETGPSTQIRMPALVTASRPLPQFLFQVSKEQEWIKDQLGFEQRDAQDTTETLAINAVRDFWKAEQIWDPTWTDLPGQAWMHEKRPQNVRSGPDEVHDEQQQQTQPDDLTIITPKHSSHSKHVEPRVHTQTAPSPGIAQRLRSSKIISNNLRSNRVKKPSPPPPRRRYRGRNAATLSKVSTRSSYYGEPVVTNATLRRSARIAALGKNQRLGC